MSHYELTITPDYAKDWSVVDAVRELFQNALDQQTTEESNTMFFEYADNTLRIGNKLSVLEAKSLLLGATTKADDETTIGQFGEGYKIAMLVLTREGHQMTIYNYGNRETWTPRFKNSRRFGTSILCVDTKKHIWTATPHNNLVIEIADISQETYEEIVMSNLHLQPDQGQCISTALGRVLLDEKYSGHLYVNGLLVTKDSKLSRGYDVLPKYLPLGRDRSMVRAFDIQWVTSRMWRSVGQEHYEEASKLLSIGAPDVLYVTTSYDKAPTKLSEKLSEQFVATHGPKAIPVSSQSQLEEVQQKYEDAKPVIVAASLKEAMHTYTTTATLREDTRSPLEKWYEKAADYLPDELLEELKEIISCL